MAVDRRAAAFWGCCGALLLASRLAHVNILWADEDYHLAVAIQILNRKIPYRDVWYDKPPLTALIDLLFGAWPGWPLRFVCAALAIGVCVAAYCLAAMLWSRREGFIAAGLLAFFQIFYLSPAIMPLEPDTLMMLPHLLAVYFAWRGRIFIAGMMAGLAFALSPKGVLALIAAGIFTSPPRWHLIVAGFAIPNAMVLGWLASQGALTEYFDQVWRFGFLYATKAGSDPQAQRGWATALGWLGFHSALVWGALSLRGPESLQLVWRLLLWIFLAIVTVAIGGRFAPRYFDLLLVALAIPAARGIALVTAGSARRIALAILAVSLAVPAIRFGPRYFLLASDNFAGIRHAWPDLAMDQDSRSAADVLNALKRPGDTLFVWGYRPNIVVYARMPVAGRWWDSQPITGVPADRHLSDSQPVMEDWARANRSELARMKPTFVVDGLSFYNPQLSMDRYDDLAEWRAQYCAIARTGGITIYRLCK